MSMSYNKEYHQKRYLANKEKMLAQSKRWAEENKEKRNALSQKWRDENKEQFKKSCKNSRNKNKANRLANNAKRRATKLQQTVSWANIDKIESMYKFAKFMEWITLGIKYHVDHIVPLNGKNVCGLHTHDNLQVIRAELNLKKGNKFNG